MRPRIYGEKHNYNTGRSDGYGKGYEKGREDWKEDVGATEVLSVESFFAGYGQCERDVEEERLTGYSHGTAFWRRACEIIGKKNCRQRRRGVVCAHQGLIPHQCGSGSELFDSSRIGSRSCSICDGHRCGIFLGQVL